MLIPIVHYCDDYGSITPPLISEDGFQTFPDFGQSSGVAMKYAKTELGRLISFLGLGGWSPGLYNNMIPTVDVSGAEKSRRVDRLGTFILDGSISRKGLGPLTGRPAYSGISIFGRPGAATTQPLYRDLNAAFYKHDLPTPTIDYG